MLELLRFAARCHVSRRDCCTADDSWRLRERRRPGGNTPIGAIGGAGAAVLGIAFGVLAWLVTPGADGGQSRSPVLRSASSRSSSSPSSSCLPDRNGATSSSAPQVTFPHAGSAKLGSRRPPRPLGEQAAHQNLPPPSAAGDCPDAALPSAYAREGDQRAV